MLGLIATDADICCHSGGLKAEQLDTMSKSLKITNNMHNISDGANIQTRAQQ